jgi:hypothetical protein
MRLTKNKIEWRDAYFPTRKLRGGPDQYFVFYTPHGAGLAFTDKEITDAVARFDKLDEGDSLFPHRWTFLRWITGLLSGRS